MNNNDKSPEMPDADLVDTNIWPPLIRGLAVILIAVGGDVVACGINQIGQDVARALQHA